MQRLKLFIILKATLFFIYSLALLVPYTDGDQLHYRIFYELMENVGIREAFQLGVAQLGAYEPLSVIILWCGAYLGIDKDVYVSILNVILLINLNSFLNRNNVSSGLKFLFLTNFYVIVLLTSAERLKIAYILLLLALTKDFKIKYFLYGLAPLAHFQSLFLLFSSYTDKVANALRKVFDELTISGKDAVLFFGALILLFIFYDQFGDGVSSKINAYQRNSAEISDFFQFTIMGFVGVYLVCDKTKIIVKLFSVAPFIFAFGGSRLNMVIFTIVVHQIIVEKKHKNILFYALMLYMSVKSIPFIFNVYFYGDGFY